MNIRRKKLYRAVIKDIIQDPDISLELKGLYCLIQSFEKQDVNSNELSKYLLQTEQWRIDDLMQELTNQIKELIIIED